MPQTVHVVDDDASFRTAIERRLKKAGYEVTTYSSAQQLLDQLAADPAGGGEDGESHDCVLSEHVYYEIHIR